MKYDLMWFDELEETEEIKKLHRVARQYVEETEEYDRTVCTGPIIRNSIMPATYREICLISNNARETFKRLVTQNQLDPKELRKIIGKIDCRWECSRNF